MRKNFQKLNLSNAFLFAATVEDSVVCRLMLETILGREIKLIKVHAEHSMLFSSDFRSVRLDIYAEDEAEVKYNLEMQNKDEGNLPQRSRYHQAEMDVMSLNPGEDYQELCPSYVIFICTFDPFDQGLYQYTFANMCLETGALLNDGAIKIFLNTKGHNVEAVSRDLVDLLQYVENSTEACAVELDNPVVTAIHNRVADIKRSREWEGRYMRFEELIQSAARDAAREAAKEAAEVTQKQLLDLVNRMLQNGEADQIPRLQAEPDFLQQMFAKYHLQ